MEKIYYPSCKLMAGFPATAQAASDYMEQCQGASIGKCCRDEETKASSDEVAVFNCNTCGIFLNEWSDADSVLSIYELLDQDKSYSFPDHYGKRMAVQDCWRSIDRPELQQAIRSLLTKMGIEIVELAESGKDSTFCGEFLMMPMPPYYLEYAPRRFGKDLPDWVFQEVEPEERAAKMKAHAAAIPVDDVVCNCMGCVLGINTGGKHAVHILELVFGT